MYPVLIYLYMLLKIGKGCLQQYSDDEIACPQEIHVTVIESVLHQFINPIDR